MPTSTLGTTAVHLDHLVPGPHPEFITVSVAPHHGSWQMYCLSAEIWLSSSSLHCWINPVLVASLDLSQSLGSIRDASDGRRTQFIFSLGDLAVITLPSCGAPIRDPQAGRHPDALQLSFPRLLPAACLAHAHTGTPGTSCDFSPAASSGLCLGGISSAETVSWYRNQHDQERTGLVP